MRWANFRSMRLRGDIKNNISRLNTLFQAMNFSDEWQFLCIACSGWQMVDAPGIRAYWGRNWQPTRALAPSSGPVNSNNVSSSIKSFPNSAPPPIVSDNKLHRKFALVSHMSSLKALLCTLSLSNHAITSFLWHCIIICILFLEYPALPGKKILTFTSWCGVY